MSSIIVPPIRAPLTDSRNGAAGRRRTTASAEAQTTRDWYLFFEKLARGLQRVNASVNQGTHEERLATAPGNVPDGALWMETDRGNAAYQVQTDENGEPVWVYIAGTMAGTLTPDERPTDLGGFDTGFQFAATDTGALYQWDGDSWVDITPDVVLGASDLDTPNVLPKIGPTPGTLVESTIYHTPAGNVGIGMASPGFALTIQRPSAQETAIQLWQAGVGSGHMGFKASDATLYLVNSYSDGTLTNGKGIAITYTGQVGIGTTPGFALDVTGQVNASNGYRAGSAGVYEGQTAVINYTKTGGAAGTLTFAGGILIAQT